MCEPCGRAASEEGAGDEARCTIVAAIRERVARIAALAAGEIDSASPAAFAHAEEDALYAFALAVIAAWPTSRRFDPAEVAREALKAREIRFDRWYE